MVTLAVGVGAPLEKSRNMDAQISSGKTFVRFCHALNILGTSCQLNEAVQTARSCAGCVLNLKDVVMPKLPPPPPRNAQNRSGSLFASQVRILPSVVTTWADTRLSQVRPYLRPTTLSPPPIVMPD